MSLFNLVLNIGLVAVGLTAIIAFVFKRKEHLWMTFLQTFCGALFLFSGWVKAVDPLGTAYKMEQYFTEFHYTFEGTAFSFLAPIFPFLSEYVVAFSVVMIVIEIALGGMLLLGTRPKLAAWSFFVITGFFTALTGFTFLTGYVPSGVNFFSLGDWTTYSESNMRVTDCGCFGDFIKLKPKVSFLKDIFLLIPAVLFILFNKRMYQLASPGFRDLSTGGLALTTLLYCFSNYVWDIPHIDFRPFKENADVRAIFEAEQDAMANVKIVAWKIQNKNDGSVIELSNDVFMSEWSKKYTSEEWEVVEQVKSDPSVEISKISDFEYSDYDGNSLSEELLADEGMTVMVVCAKLKGETEFREVVQNDTTFVTDTVWSETKDTFELMERVGEVTQRTEERSFKVWPEAYKNAFVNTVNPFVDAAIANGAKAVGLVGGAGQNAIQQLREDMGCNYMIYEADDILLKTIVRSNPGVVIWKNGKILKKWHYKKLPDFNEVSNMF